MNETNNFQQELNFIKYQVDKGGPTETEYEAIDNWHNKIWTAYETGIFTEENIQALRTQLDNVYKTPTTMLGLTYLAPYGYKGDFEIIDRIYQGYITNEDKLSNWDKYFQRQSAAKAVRNRKGYFKNLLGQKCNEQTNLKVLNIASGPCRDLKEFHEEYKRSINVKFDCVEFDPRAIAYAKEIIPNLEKVNFIQQNIFKFTTEEKYDLIWSAGLFDYFDDETFIRILNRTLKYMNPDSEIVIGNFHPRNPTKCAMELAEWKLHHRDEKKLNELAREAGVNGEENIIIDEESEGVNLFMRIKK